jgi:hypothetical protein
VIWNVSSWMVRTGSVVRIFYLLGNDVLSLIYSQEKNLIVTVFYTRPAIHNPVNIDLECRIGGNFVVDYH